MVYKLEHNDILVNKGFKWSKLFKLDIEHISMFVIQIITLSRYTHTSIYLQYLNKAYILESHLFKGIYLKEIDSIEHLYNQIKKNRIDVLRYRHRKTRLTYYRRRIKTFLMHLYSSEEKVFKLGSYNLFGVFNQLIYNIFDKSIIKSTNKNKMFCSETTHYFFTEDDLSFLRAPNSLIESNLYIKVI